MNYSINEINPIGRLHSPFKEKFGLPRQPGLIRCASATIEFYPPYNNQSAFTGLSEFSHIWLTFQFHKNDNSKWRPLIRPPRLGGNEKTGVFASRSSFRPNGLGMSLVKLIKVAAIKGEVGLEIECPDIIDSTPILDIRPYIQYADSVANARCAYAENVPDKPLEVNFSNESLKTLRHLDFEIYGNLKGLIEETIGYDPRPAYRDESDLKQYGLCLYDLNIRWKINNKIAEVLTIEKFKGIVT